METPFEIGKTYYRPKLGPTQVKNPCYVCKGQKYVTVIDGDSVAWEVDCEACNVGFEGSKGYVTQWEYVCGVEPFTIKEVSSYSGGHWYVKDYMGDGCSWDELYPTYEDAIRESHRRIAEHIEDNHKREVTSKKSMLAKRTWTLRYHQECLKKLRQQIDWHEGKIKKGELAKCKA